MSGPSTAEVGASALQTRLRVGGTTVDPQFPVSQYICDYDAFLDLCRFAAMRMNGDSTTVWDVTHHRHCNTAVEACCKRCLPQGGRGTLMSLCVGTDVDSPFVLCFKKVDYDESLSKMASAKRGRLMSEMPSTGPWL